MIQVDLSNIWGELSLSDLLSIEKEIFDAHAMLTEGTGEGAAFRDWLSLPDRKSPGELLGILRAAEQIRSDSDICVVVGAGGSVSGARAAIELLQGPNRNIRRGKGDPRILFAGNSLSTRQWNELKGLLEGNDVSVIVISKSGTTLESAIAFRNLRWMLERRYGTDEANRRIYAVTDPDSGPLRQMARENGWDSFAIASGAGGAFSVLSPGGLLPMAVAGLDIMAMLEGAAEAKEVYELRSFENPVWLYAAVRNLMYRSGKAIELLVGFEPGFQAFGYWWQQLFAESEGKDGKGLFPATAEFTAGLHSLGQLILEGRRNLFETVVRFDPPEQVCTVGFDVLDPDGLNYLAEKQLDYVEETAFRGMVDAHTGSGVGVITVDCGPLNERTLGELFFFLELCCAVSAYTLGVNPFERPGVEQYKQDLFGLLGKPPAQT